MNIDIKFARNLSAEDSYHLDALSSLIEQDCDIPVQSIKQSSAPGIKDGGLTIGLAIAGLTLSFISTLISVLSYWKSQNPRYSISLTRGDYTLSIDNISPEKVQKAISDIKEQKPELNTVILIADTRD